MSKIDPSKLPAGIKAFPCNSPSHAQRALLAPDLEHADYGGTYTGPHAPEWKCERCAQFDAQADAAAMDSQRAEIESARAKLGDALKAAGMTDQEIEQAFVAAVADALAKRGTP